jgi:hypothetical protein
MTCSLFLVCIPELKAYVSSLYRYHGAGNTGAWRGQSRLVREGDILEKVDGVSLSHGEVWPIPRYVFDLKTSVRKARTRSKQNFFFFKGNIVTTLFENLEIMVVHNA